MDYLVVMLLLLCYIIFPVVSGYVVLSKTDESLQEKTNLDDTPVAGATSDNTFAVENETLIDETSVEEIKDAEVYLEKYGYMDVDNSTDNKTLQTKFNEGLKEFQDMEGLNVTGTLDEETKIIMHKPRCGLPDVYHNSSRTKRYALHGSMWPTQKLYYKIVSRPKTFGGDLDAEIQQAFDIWSEFIPLTFHKTDERATIEIRFGHIDGYRNILAQAYFPSYGGNILFDTSETWTSDSYSGINFLQVAVHEIGHSLGILHSHVYDAIMHATYTYVRNFALHQDDINASQYLYGSKPPDICADATLDAVVTTEDLSMFAFKENWYYKMGPSERYFNVSDPRPLTDWAGIKGPIDAAVYSDNMTILFKGIRYWIFKNLQLIKGPEKIKTNDVGFNGHFNAALVYKNNGRLYLLKDDKYWRLRSGMPIDFDGFVHAIDVGYPKSIDIWGFKGVKIDAAVLWPHNGRNYFFSGKNYYRYNKTSLAFDSGYPRKTGALWFDCDED